MDKFLNLEGLQYLWDKIKQFIIDYSPSKSDINNKQDKLVSGVNIKTINNSSILGSGDIQTALNLSDLNDDQNHRLVTDSEKLEWSSKSDFSGLYGDLGDKPYINSVLLSGNMSAADLGLLSAMTIDYTIMQGSHNPVMNSAIYHMELLLYSTITTDFESLASGKQNNLVSGVNIKTVNGYDILGSGNIVIQEGIQSVNGKIGIVVLDYNDVGALSSGTTIPSSVSELNNDSGYITGITSGNVITALGYTPYNSTNPSGFTSNTGTVVGPASSTDAHVVVFNGTDGISIKDSGYTILTSVPSGAVFTDTTYENKVASSGGTDVSLVTTGEKYSWDNKATINDIPLIYIGTATNWGPDSLDCNLKPTYFQNGVVPQKQGDYVYSTGNGNLHRCGAITPVSGQNYNKTTPTYVGKLNSYPGSTASSISSTDITNWNNAILTISIGTTTTGNAGTNASVSNSGTLTNPILNFTIPRGDTGASGLDYVLTSQDKSDIATLVLAQLPIYNGSVS